MSSENKVMPDLLKKIYPNFSDNTRNEILRDLENSKEEIDQILENSCKGECTCGDFETMPKNWHSKKILELIGKDIESIKIVFGESCIRKDAHWLMAQNLRGSFNQRLIKLPKITGNFSCKCKETTKGQQHSKELWLKKYCVIDTQIYPLKPNEFRTIGVEMLGLNSEFLMQLLKKLPVKSEIYFIYKMVWEDVNSWIKQCGDCNLIQKWGEFKIYYYQVEDQSSCPESKKAWKKVKPNK